MIFIELLSKEKDTNGKFFELGNGSSFVLKQKEEWAIRINLIFGKLLTKLSITSYIIRTSFLIPHNYK